MFDFESENDVETVCTEVENEIEMETTIKNLMDKTMWLEEQICAIEHKQDETDLLMKATVVKVVEKVVQSMMNENQSNEHTESIDKT